MKTGEELAVFVYGTLMPGGRAWAERCEGKVVEMGRARVRGRLFDLKLAGYPAVLNEVGMEDGKWKMEKEAAAGGAAAEHGLKHGATEGWVRGWRLVLRDAGVLRGLDAWEGYVEGRVYSENEYERVRVECYGEENSNDEIRMTNEEGKKKKRGLKLRATPGGARLGGAWVYVMRAERIAELGGVEVPGGEWAGRGGI